MNQIICAFALFYLHMSVSNALNCSAPFKDILGVCLHFPTTSYTWCGAQSYCSSVEGELVRGASYLPLNNKIFPGMPTHYWIGLTDFLHERKRNRAGWRWTDGAVLPASSELVWDGSEPGQFVFGKQDCVFQCYGRGTLCDLNCKPDLSGWKTKPMCQPRAPISDTKHFEITDIPTGLRETEFDYAESNGCGERLTGIASKLVCAIRCNNKAIDWCVAFYYNKTTKECILVLYTDATINVGSSAAWQKFVIKKAV